MEEVIGLELCVNEYNFKYFLCVSNLFIYNLVAYKMEQ